MKQQCHVSFVYGSWLILAGGIVFYLLRGHYLQASLWLFFVSLCLWLYVRYFSFLARYLGYGSVQDQPATTVGHTAVQVVLYTGVGCPFCPLVERRLRELQSRMEFDLKQVDITLKPGLLIAKGMRALPVIEVGEAQWVGNGTSEQLAQFIQAHAVPKV